MLEFLDNHKNGILATIAVHLLVIVIFFFMKLRYNDYVKESKVLISYSNTHIKEQPIDQTSIKSEKKENILNSGKGEKSISNNISNTPVNVSEKFKENISTEKYEQEVLKDLNIENLHQQNDPDKIMKSKDGYTIPNQVNNVKKDKEVNFHGKTNITYDLANRKHSSLSVPVYKCEGSAEVTIAISVDQDGDVIEASVNSVRTDYEDDCFADAAKDAALKSRFISSYSAPSKQKGSITYKFVAQ